MEKSDPKTLISREEIVFKEHAIDGYERVIEITDDSVGLHAIISIHNTTLGPALGGTRAYVYSSFEDGLKDVLRLSRGMTYKSAISETGTGGGKSVIILKDNRKKTKELLERFGEAVTLLEGEYICAEDVGMSLTDLGVVAGKTRYAVGLPHAKSSGDPSPYTAWGTFRGIEAVCHQLWRSDSLEGKVVAIQGLGAVGMLLARNLFWAGAKLIVADINPRAVESARQEFGATVVSVDEILGVECDILAPCAMGGILNEESIQGLKCRAVAGSANNQLATAEDGRRLQERGILYAPDYLINSGGLLNVCVEIEKEGYNPSKARLHVDRIYNLLITIFTLAEEKNRSTDVIADEIAEDNIAKEIGKRTEKPYFHQ